MSLEADACPTMYPEHDYLIYGADDVCIAEADTTDDAVMACLVLAREGEQPPLRVVAARSGAIVCICEPSRDGEGIVFHAP